MWYFKGTDREGEARKEVPNVILLIRTILIVQVFWVLPPPPRKDKYFI